MRVSGDAVSLLAYLGCVRYWGQGSLKGSLPEPFDRKTLSQKRWLRLVEFWGLANRPA